MIRNKREKKCLKRIFAKLNDSFNAVKRAINIINRHRLLPLSLSLSLSLFLPYSEREKERRTGNDWRGREDCCSSFKRKIVVASSDKKWRIPKNNLFGSDLIITVLTVPGNRGVMDRAVTCGGGRPGFDPSFIQMFFFSPV